MKIMFNAYDSLIARYDPEDCLRVVKESFSRLNDNELTLQDSYYTTNYSVYSGTYDKVYVTLIYEKDGCQFKWERTFTLSKNEL